jgi:hypothetical protein
VSNISEAQLQSVGLAMIFVVVVAAGLSVTEGHLTKDTLYDSRSTFALTMASDDKQVRCITRGRPELENDVQTFFILDSFAFVPLYFSYFLLLSWLLWRSPIAHAKALAITAIIFTFLTAIADQAENYLAYRTLGGDFLAIYPASYMKWGASFITTGILSIIFWHGRWRVATVLLAMGILVGMAAFFVKPKNGSYFVGSYLGVLVGVTLCTGLLLMIQPSRRSFLEWSP